jgi:hypothetical protein
MDGISAAASIIAVIQLTASVAETLKDYYEAVRDARRDIQRLYHSINSLEVVLRAIQALDIRYEDFSKVLKDVNGPLQSTLYEMKSIQKKLGPSTVFNTTASKFFKSLTWPFQKGDVEKILVVIERNKSTLALAFSIQNM